MLRNKMHAFSLTVDAELLLPPILLGYRYAFHPRLELGWDLGGNYGLFEVLLHAKTRFLETADHRFFWGSRLRTGYKDHHWSSAGEAIVFDDRSWVFSFDNILAYRLGRQRNKAFYLNTTFYIDLDLRTPHRQTDFYLVPAALGYEMNLALHFNIFVELGLGIALNGTETYKGVLYKGDLFPLGKLGGAFLF